MKSYIQFTEDLAVRKRLYNQRRANQTSAFMQRGAEHQQKRAEDAAKEQERKSIKGELKKEIKRELRSEAYDKEVMSSSQIRRQGEGGRIGAERKKSTPERRRMKAVGGGKMEPVDYKPRSDIGKQKQRSEREQQPTQERGSAREQQLAAAKEERRKAAKARIAAKAKKAEPEAKPKAKEVSKVASKLLSKKKEEKPVSASYKPQKASGLSTQERKALYKKGERSLRDVVLQSTGKKSEKELKHKYTSK
jgi:hypothetical protein